MHRESSLEHDGVQHGSEALHDIGGHQHVHVFFQVPFGILWKKKKGKARDVRALNPEITFP